MAEEKVRKKANTTSLRWDVEDDQPAIEAIREVAKELNYDFKGALRWVCVNMKSQAIDKAKQIQKLLKAS
jgi:hypothetical protein